MPNVNYQQPMPDHSEPWRSSSALPLRQTCNGVKTDKESEMKDAIYGKNYSR